MANVDTTWPRQEMHRHSFLAPLALRISAAPESVRAGVVLALAAVISWLDFVTPTYVSLYGFYLLPLFLSIWYCRPGLALLVLGDTVGVNLYMAYLLMPREAPLWEQVIAYSSPVIVFVGFAVLIEALKAVFKRLHRESRSDALTGLRSRRGFLELAEMEIAMAARGGHEFTVAIVDLDNFKHVNDAQGHAVGDTVLAAVGRSMTGTLRGIDLIGRIGGDEFAILLPETGAREAAIVLDRVITDLRRVLQSFGPGLGASIGAIAVPGGVALPMSDILVRADAVMYSIKRDSKDRVVVQMLA